MILSNLDHNSKSKESGRDIYAACYGPKPSEQLTDYEP